MHTDVYVGTADVISVDTVTDEKNRADTVFVNIGEYTGGTTIYFKPETLSKLLEAIDEAIGVPKEKVLPEARGAVDDGWPVDFMCCGEWIDYPTADESRKCETCGTTFELATS